jgi:hypothetical protein
VRISSNEENRLSGIAEKGDRYAGRGVGFGAKLVDVQFQKPHQGGVRLSTDTFFFKGVISPRGLN